MQPPFRHSLRLPLALAIAVLLCLGSTGARAEAPTAATYPPQEITADKSCSACGMYPSRYLPWQQQLIFKDGTMAAFDGGKCLFRFLHNMAEFDAAHTVADVAMIWVKDFDTGAWTDGTKAYYVVGSNVLGPMGKEIIPFATRDAAQKFQQQNGGVVGPYDSITMTTVKPLMEGMMHMHQGGHQPASAK